MIVDLHSYCILLKPLLLALVNVCTFFASLHVNQQSYWFTGALTTNMSVIVCCCRCHVIVVRSFGFSLAATSTVFVLCQLHMIYNLRHSVFRSLFLMFSSGLFLLFTLCFFLSLPPFCSPLHRVFFTPCVHSIRTLCVSNLKHSVRQIVWWVIQSFVAKNVGIQDLSN